jgi:hypothetical protein
MSPHIAPWSVLWLLWRFAETPTTKDDKFTIVVGLDGPHLLAVVVNTKVHKFIASDPIASQCQVPLEENYHKRFLRHDSFDIFTVRITRESWTVFACPIRSRTITKRSLPSIWRKTL